MRPVKSDQLSKQLDNQREVLKKSIEELTESLEKKLQ